MLSEWVSHDNSPFFSRDIYATRPCGRGGRYAYSSCRTGTSRSVHVVPGVVLAWPLCSLKLLRRESWSRQSQRADAVSASVAERAQGPFFRVPSCDSAVRPVDSTQTTTSLSPRRLARMKSCWPFSNPQAYCGVECTRGRSAVQQCHGTRAPRRLAARTPRPEQILPLSSRYDISWRATAKLNWSSYSREACAGVRFAALRSS